MMSARGHYGLIGRSAITRAPPPPPPNPLSQITQKISHFIDSTNTAEQCVVGGGLFLMLHQTTRTSNLVSMAARSGPGRSLYLPDLLGTDATEEGV